MKGRGDAHEFLDDVHEGFDKNEGAGQTEREEVVMSCAENDFVHLCLVGGGVRVECLWEEEEEVRRGK